MGSLEFRVKSSEARTGKPVVLSPYVPETILRWDAHHERWQTKNPRTGSTAFHAQVVWEHYNGPLPDGYVVHHKSGSASRIEDDAPENLMLLKKNVNSKLFPVLADEMMVNESIITDAYVASDGDFKRFLFILSKLE